MSARSCGRVLASAGLFASLGLGGLALSLAVCPFLWLLPARRRQASARTLIRRCFQGFVWGLEASRILRVQVEDLPDANALRGAILIANHPSWLDIVVLLSRLPDPVCIVKRAVWWNPFFGLLVRTAGFLAAEDAESLLDQASGTLAAGQAVILFPEGTRTAPGKPLCFQRGAAHLALLTGAPIHPLFISVVPPLLEKGDRWYDMPIQTCQFRIRGRHPISLPMTPPEGPARVHGARQATEMLETFYNREFHGPQHHHA